MGAGGSAHGAPAGRAARYADEVNLDGMSPAQVADALPVIAGRCEEIDRDPAGLAVSVHVWSEQFGIGGTARRDLLAGYREVGVSRVMGLDRATARTDDALASLAEDARAAGVELG